MIIVGSGLCGTLIANKLKIAGRRCTVLEKSKNHGRMATRYIDEKTTVDIGAQFFTIRQPKFKTLVNEWIDDGIVQEWCTGFPPKNDKYPRYIVRQGMRHLVSVLAKECDVQFDQCVESITETELDFIVKTKTNEYRSNTIILTTPIPQAIPFVQDILPSQDLKLLQNIKYYPCLTLLFESKEQISFCGAYQFKGNVVDFLCNNKVKGISKSNIITLHCAPNFSEDHYNLPLEEIVKFVQQELDTFTTIKIQDATLKRWKYAQPKVPFDALSLQVNKSTNKKIIFAGDQFGKSKIEGTCLSALHVVESLSSSQ